MEPRGLRLVVGPGWSSRALGAGRGIRVCAPGSRAGDSASFCLSFLICEKGPLRAWGRSPPGSAPGTQEALEQDGAGERESERQRRRRACVRRGFPCGSRVRARPWSRREGPGRVFSAREGGRRGKEPTARPAARSDPGRCGSSPTCTVLTCSARPATGVRSLGVPEWMTDGQRS